MCVRACVRACVCVCVRERERDRESVCVWVCVLLLLLLLLVVVVVVVVVVCMCECVCVLVRARARVRMFEVTRKTLIEPLQYICLYGMSLCFWFCMCFFIIYFLFIFIGPIAFVLCASVSRKVYVLFQYSFTLHFMHHLMWKKIGKTLRRKKKARLKSGGIPGSR